MHALLQYCGDNEFMAVKMSYVCWHGSNAECVWCSFYRDFYGNWDFYGKMRFLRENEISMEKCDFYGIWYFYGKMRFQGKLRFLSENAISMEKCDFYGKMRFLR